MKFGVRVQTWDILPQCLILLKSLKGSCPLEANFYQKFEIYTILSYLSPHFYTNNVEILLRPNRKDLGIHQRHRISSKSLKRPVITELKKDCSMSSALLYAKEVVASWRCCKIETQLLQTTNKKLSCCREALWCYVSLQILLSHSRSFEITIA